MSVKILMEKASKAYYDGQPIMSNEEYDALEAIHGQIIGGSGDIRHAYRMYSLKKHYDKDGEMPLNLKECVKTPKLDGAACDVFFVNGHFEHSLTRGDGIMGRDISTKLITLGIPLEVRWDGMVQVTGEIVARKDVENSRNFASGALGIKDRQAWEDKVEEGDMIFVAYNVQHKINEWGKYATYREDMKELQREGFRTILSGDYENYPKDGTVFRLDNNAEFNDRGFTDKFPRGAFAHKDEQEAVTTTLLAVEWQCGKSGKVTPVAILEPVIIGEAEIARATLNNIAYIEALDLEIGCTVEVIRSGEIIPKIIGRVYS